MSAFLGPIHFWMFNKIRTQEELTQALLAVFPEEKEGLEQKLNEVCGMPKNGKLEEIIDEGNIHGWLQEQVTLVEKRFAQAAAGLLSSDPGRLEALTKAAYAFGETHPFSQAKTLQDAFQSMNDVMLDGMPCDHVNSVVEQDDKSICWERRLDLHSAYWKEAGADPAVFEKLRSAWLNGMLSKSSFRYYQEENRFYLTA